MGCPIYTAVLQSPAAAALVPARPLPRYHSGPTSFSLTGWRRGAPAPLCLHLHSQRGLPGTPLWLAVCFWRRKDSCRGLVQHLMDQWPLQTALQPLDWLMLGCQRAASDLSLPPRSEHRSSSPWAPTRVLEPVAWPDVSSLHHLAHSPMPGAMKWSAAKDPS